MSEQRTLSRGEYFSLEKIVRCPRLLIDIPAKHAERLVDYGLVLREGMLLYATPLGQLATLHRRLGAT